jgi:hypothetical protein
MLMSEKVLVSDIFELTFLGFWQFEIAQTT